MIILINNNVIHNLSAETFGFPGFSILLAGAKAVVAGGRRKLGVGRLPRPHPEWLRVTRMDDGPSGMAAGLVDVSMALWDGHGLVTLW